MPRASSAKIKNLKNLNKFKNNYAKMETDQSSDEDDDRYILCKHIIQIVY